MISPYYFIAPQYKFMKIYNLKDHNSKLQLRKMYQLIPIYYHIEIKLSSLESQQIEQLLIRYILIRYNNNLLLIQLSPKMYRYVNFSPNSSSQEEETKLPYNRKEINTYFKIPPEEDQPTCTLQECQEVIKDSLQDLDQYQYDFLYTSDQSGQNRFNDDIEKGIQKRRSIKRKVKLKFVCQRCQSKNWTSIVGTMEMDFQFSKQKEEKKRKYPYLLIFKLIIYRMECINCHQYGIPIIYSSQLQCFAKSANLTLTKILDQVPPPKYYDNRYKFKQEIHGHIQRLCEACKLNKCFAKPK